MGVPAFFRWLSRKYVSIIVDAVEERRREAENGVKVPVDCTLPNQNFQEFDNLYLDMNGIIHPCTHPEDRPAPKTEEEMFILIFEYIDRLFSIVRPRKVLYMAIDGVAPRAKMNQQRSRRFRSAKEATEKREQIENIRKKLESEGVPLPPPRKEEEHFDSNCITPGTPFMARLATALRYYIHKRITYDPAWMNIQVILSDANVPGEGEHKIMDYIRRQRASPSHDPNTVHCLCGADADLIMLGLATHESNFNIIREEFVPNQPRACELCGQYGHELEHCQGLARAEAAPEQADPLKKEKNFIFIRLPVLREYLERELVMPNLPFPFDLERAIDDWVMMCFFVGNDFLPHLPSLEIRENAIDRLIKLYKNMVYQTGGWLTEDGEVNVDRVRIIMVELGKVEDEIFKERQLRELRFKDSQKQRKKRAKEVAQMLMPHNTKYLTPRALGDQRLNLSGEQIRKAAADDRQQMQQQAQKLKSLLTPAVATATESKSTTSIGSKRKATDPVQTADDSPTGAPPAKSFKDGRNKPEESKSEEEQQQATSKPTIMSIMPSGQKMPLARGAVGALMGNNDESEEEPEDEIRLWEAGWKDRYYNAKFKVSESDKEFRRKVACAYVEGLSWVLRYYYQGCASWTWFFPYHYAPFASDFDLIGDFKPDFSKPTRPFRPLEQLMGVFPAASRAHIPESWRWLMTDEKSPIIDLYPEDFEIDLNGKKYAWQGVALLPFVDEKRLLSSLDTVYDQLTPEEIARNATGPDRLFIGKRHELFELVQQVHEQGKQGRDGDGEREKGGVEEMNNGEEKADEEVMEGNAKESKENENGTAEKNGNDTTEEEGDESNGDHVVNGLLKKEMEKRWVLIDASKAFGMAGEVSHDVNALEFGQTHESIFRNSLEFSDIKNNSCLMVEFRDPQFPTNFCFKAQRLSGINELPRVLKPRDYDERRQGPYRPQIGFSRNVPRASLSFTGHRTLGHHIVDQQQQYQPNDRRSGPASLMSLQTSSTFQYQAPPQQPLPWHKSNQQPLQQQPLQMPPPLLNFQQMALPPPPMPPQSWLQPQGGYVGQWGQPPPFVAAPPQRDNSSSWRGGSQPWSQQQGANSSSQQPLPYHRRSLDQQQQQAGPSPQQYGGGANNRGNPRSNHGDRDNHANSQGGQQQNQQQPPRPYASQSRTGPKEFTPSYHQHY